MLHAGKRELASPLVLRLPTLHPRELDLELELLDLELFRLVLGLLQCDGVSGVHVGGAGEFHQLVLEGLDQGAILLALRVPILTLLLLVVSAARVIRQPASSKIS